MKETFYFPHDYHARHDYKINNMFLDLGVQAIGVYWCIVEMLYESNGILPTNYERISKALRVDESFVIEVLNNYELFKVSNHTFYSESVNRRLEERRIKSDNARASVNKRWNKDTNVLQTNYDGNTIKESKVKEKKVKESKKAVIPPLMEAVVAYCKEINSPIDGEAFWHYYNQTNWVKANGQVVINWKSTIKTWEKRKVLDVQPGRRMLE